MVTTARALIPTIDYTSRDYQSLRMDMIRLIRARIPQWAATNNADFGVALVEAYAYAADTVHYYLDRIANEAYLSTAVQRESLYSIAEMFNYTPRAAVAATVRLQFVNSTPSDIVLPAGTRCQASVVTSSGSIIRNYETDIETILPRMVGVDAKGEFVPSTEGRTYTNEALGVSDGTIKQQFLLPRTSVLPQSVTITTQAGESSLNWSETLDLNLATPVDRLFQILRQTDGSSVVRFGNGVQGMIPPMHSIIRASYRVGGGSEGNVSVGSITTLVEPVLYGVSVNNAEPAMGGQNAESIDSIRINAARAFRARDRAVTIADYEAVSANAPGVAKSKAIGNNGSSVTIYVAPFTDATLVRGSMTSTVTSKLTSDQKLAIVAYLEQRAMAGVTVSVFGPLWIQVYMKITAHCRPTASQNQVEHLIRTALSSYYGFTNVDFDGRVAASDISNALVGIDGLDYIEVNDLSLDARIMAKDYAGAPSADTILFNEHATGGIHFFSERENLRLTLLGGIGPVSAT